MCRRSKKNILEREKLEIENKLHGIQSALDTLAYKKKAFEGHLPAKAIFAFVCAINASILVLIVRHFIHSEHGHKIDVLHAIIAFVSVFSICAVYRRILIMRMQRTMRKMSKYLKEKENLLDRVVEDLPVNAAVRLLTTYDSQDSNRMQSLVTTDPRLVEKVEQYQQEKEELITALGVAISVTYAIAPGGYTQAYNALKPIGHLLQKYHKELDLSRRVPSATFLSVMSHLDKGAESLLGYITPETAAKTVRETINADETPEFNNGDESPIMSLPTATDTAPGTVATTPKTYEDETAELVEQGLVDVQYVASPYVSEEDKHRATNQEGAVADRTLVSDDEGAMKEQKGAETEEKEDLMVSGVSQSDVPEQRSSEDREETPYFDATKDSKQGTKEFSSSVGSKAVKEKDVVLEDVDNSRSVAEGDIQTEINESPMESKIDKGVTTASVARAVPVTANNVRRRRKKKK